MKNAVSRDTEGSGSSKCVQWNLLIRKIFEGSSQNSFVAKFHLNATSTLNASMFRSLLFPSTLSWTSEGKDLIASFRYRGPFYHLPSSIAEAGCNLRLWMNARCQYHLSQFLGPYLDNDILMWMRVSNREHWLLYFSNSTRRICLAKHYAAVTIIHFCQSSKDYRVLAFLSWKCWHFLAFIFWKIVMNEEIQ